MKSYFISAYQTLLYRAHFTMEAYIREREKGRERGGEREVGGGERELKLSNTLGGEMGGRIGGKIKGRLISGVFFTAHCSAFSVRHLKYLLHCSLMKMPT